MSFSPSLSIVRLQELKLWQGSYDNLLKRSRSNLKSEEGSSREVVSLEEIANTSFQSLKNACEEPKEWDKRKISPMKPFEQLLEEKLAEDMPVPVNPRPKKPFLRKGQGLARFRMGVSRPPNVKNKNAGCKAQVPPKSVPKPLQKSPSFQRKGILKKTNPFYHQEVDLSPLTVPEFVKSRGTWKEVFESSKNDFRTSLSKNLTDSEEDQETLENYEEFRKSLGSEECNNLCKEDCREFKASSSKHVSETNSSGNDGGVKKDGKNEASSNFEGFNKEMLQKVNEHARHYFNGPNALISNDIPDSLVGLETPKLPKHLGDLTLEELKMERELKIFEALEEKVDSSSFCSTNTSVANLLASTPRKAGHFLMRHKIIEEQEGKNVGSVDVTVNSVFPKNMQENVHKKLQEVSEKTDVLQQFLVNLRRMGHKNRTCDKYGLESDKAGKRDEKVESADTSFSDENTRWSSRSPSLSENCTELETTCQSDNWRKVDACVNTSFDNSKCEETVKNLEPCKECEELRSKHSETKMKLTDLKSENSQLKTGINDLQNEYDKYKKARKKDEEYFEERLGKLENELDSERKKFAKERTYFENYVKEAQNRPSKKEREEITRLKQELADVKELLKLKDTKNGATQARLRTQIKQQEKELTELKITVEKLQKENAKLTVSQKYARRPQEVKMLHEINKNLSKLAEETFKKHVGKSGNGDAEEPADPGSGRKSRNVSSERWDKENEKGGKNINNKANKDGFGTSLNSTPPTDGLSIEQQYESLFGSFPSPRNVSVSTNLEKTERTLTDGSLEVIYSNGNRKTVSADGKIITMKYFNGDTKETNLNEQIIRYHYAAADSWHTQYPDGTEIMEFKDGQKCKKYQDGKTEITYPDGSSRIINVDGTEEHQFPDGRKALKNLQGEQIILLPNGQKEIHTQDYKRREYPDGTIRTLHKDGTVETVYANGRVRLKDANGVLLMDTHNS